MPLKKIRWVIALVIVVVLAIAGLCAAPYFGRSQANTKPETELRILAYASFAASWGPGPKLVELFEEKMRTGNQPTRVILLQAEDAGLLLAKMRAFPADIVLGFDQLGLRLAEKQRVWRPHLVTGSKYSTDQFLAFDWAPIGFIYRRGEIDPPKNFADLLSPRFESAIALQDPRSSSPGFQFLNWLVTEMGEDEAFKYLKKLKPNVQSMSGSWSQAYGLFTRGLAKLTFSYATSILYHRVSEKDLRYEFAKFSVAHPVQIEYAAISDQCRNCDSALKFMKFLSEPEAQEIIMSRNWMLPVNDRALIGSPFGPFLKEIETQSESKLTNDPALVMNRAAQSDPEALLKRWQETQR